MLLLTIALLCCVYFLPKPVHAEENKTANSQVTSSQGIGFTVKAIPPETQIDKAKTFFYPLVKPNVSQELKIALTSIREEPVKISLAIQNAQTSYLGNIEYLSADKPHSKTLKQPISDLITLDESEVELTNFETRIISLHVIPPEESFSGIKLGSVYISEISDDQKEGITNNYAYNIGIILTEDQEDYHTGNQLELLDVYGTTRNGDRGVVSVFENPQPLILEELQVQTKITKKNESEIIREQTQSGLRMAPNSTMDFMTDWGIEDILPGEYTMHIEAKSKSEKWSWTKDFSISKKAANKINESASVSLTFPNQFFTWVLILSISTILLFLSCVFLLNKSKGIELDET